MYMLYILFERAGIRRKPTFENFARSHVNLSQVSIEIKKKVQNIRRSLKYRAAILRNKRHFGFAM